MNGASDRSSRRGRVAAWRTAVVMATGAALLIPAAPAQSEQAGDADRPPGLSATKPRAVVGWNSDWYYSGLAVQGSRNGRRLVAVWQATQSDGDGRTRIESAFSRDAGRTWRRRKVTPTGSAQDPQLVVSADGRTATVVWVDLLARGRILSRTSSNGGRRWRTVRDVSRREAYDPVVARVAASDDGRRVVVAWAESDAELTEDSVTTQLSATVSGNAGRTWSVPETVTTDFRGGRFTVLVSPDGSRSAMAWEGVSPDAYPPDYSVRVVTWGQSADGWSEPADVANVDGLRDLRMTWAPRGNRLFLAWVEVEDYGEVGVVRSARSPDDGLSWTGPQELFRLAGNVYLLGGPFLLRRGRKVSVALLVGPGGGRESIWLTRSRDFGESFTSPARVLRLRDFAEDEWTMPLVRSKDGRTLVTAWAGAISGQLLASRSTDGGKNWSRPTSLERRRHMGSAPQLVVSRNGRRATAVWIATTFSRPEYSQRIAASRLR